MRPSPSPSPALPFAAAASDRTVRVVVPGVEVGRRGLGRQRLFFSNNTDDYEDAGDDDDSGELIGLEEEKEDGDEEKEGVQRDWQAGTSLATAAAAAAADDEAETAISSSWFSPMIDGSSPQPSDSDATTSSCLSIDTGSALDNEKEVGGVEEEADNDEVYEASYKGCRRPATPPPLRRRKMKKGRRLISVLKFQPQ